MRSLAPSFVSLLLLFTGCSGSTSSPEDRTTLEPPDASVADSALDAADTADPGPDFAAEDDEPPPDLPAPRPPAAPGLERYLTGDPDDALVAPEGPALILMGGGAEVDAAFEWWTPRLAGGDVVVLRTSGSDGYNEYLYSDFGSVDSVETFLVTSRALADSELVAWAVENAEGIWLAGGDQSTYLSKWADTGLQRALGRAWQRGALIGGTSAGCAVLGEVAFAAYQGSVTSAEALEDPFNSFVTLDAGLFVAPFMGGTITDTHFAARDRMGRLVAFVARIKETGRQGRVVGLGVDERTALVVSDGVGTVMGSGAVYVVRGDRSPTTCAPGQPLTYALEYARLTDGGSVELPSGQTSETGRDLEVSGGTMVPADPYTQP